MESVCFLTWELYGIKAVVLGLGIAMGWWLRSRHE